MATQPRMPRPAKPISVIGVGQMGAAIARTLGRAGCAVTVWNRTPAKADALRAEGIAVAADLGAAAAASPLVIMCLADTTAVRAVQSDSRFGVAMRGRTLVQFTNGSTADAEAGLAWARECGVEYLCGTILSVPAMLGTRDATVLYFGAHETFAKHAESLEALSSVELAGPDHGQIGTLTASLECFAITALVGFLQGAALIQASGLDLRQYLQASLACWPTIRSALSATPDMVTNRNYVGRQASIDVLLSSARLMLESCARAGIRLELVQAVLKYFELAAHRFAADLEFQAAVEVIRTPDSASPAEEHAATSVLRCNQKP